MLCANILQHLTFSCSSVRQGTQVFRRCPKMFKSNSPGNEETILGNKLVEHGRKRLEVAYTAQKDRKAEKGRKGATHPPLLLCAKQERHQNGIRGRIHPLANPSASIPSHPPHTPPTIPSIHHQNLPPPQSNILHRDKKEIG
jgi:hypothetical protein